MQTKPYSYTHSNTPLILRLTFRNPLPAMSMRRAFIHTTAVNYWQRKRVFGRLWWQRRGFREGFWCGGGFLMLFRVKCSFGNSVSARWSKFWQKSSERLIHSQHVEDLSFKQSRSQGKQAPAKSIGLIPPRRPKTYENKLHFYHMLKHVISLHSSWLIQTQTPNIDL